MLSISERMPLILKILMTIASFTGYTLADCPRLCECKWKSGKESVICFNANLSVIPLHLDAGTQVLDLTGNNLAVVKHDEFSNAGLVNLQKVYISKCRLKNLERYSFRNLINLVELDLSYNVLSSVPSHTLDSISELRELKLNGNPITRISNDAFIHVPQLIRLEMTDCRLSVIEPRAFRGLGRSLEWLKLDKNKLQEVSAVSLEVLQNLHGIELAANPWNCSCGLRPLREWMLRRNVPFGIPPVCSSPKRLQSKPWDKLDLDEFACVPEIFAYDSKAHGIEGRNVTMTCRIAGVPEPNVIWMLKNKVIANLSSSSFTSGKRQYLLHLKDNSSNLTIFSADFQDAGTYVCAAENKAGRAEASVTLAVSKKPPEAGFNGRILIASILTGIGLVLVSCFIAVCICTFRKKQLLKWRTRENRRDDNYEKIEMNHHKIINVNGGVNQEETNRRNGEYRVVPCDSEHEVEEEEAVPPLEPAKVQNWTAMDKIEKRWNSPEHLLDPEDLHIPRRTLQERDSIKKMKCSYNQFLPSTSGSLPLRQIGEPNHNKYATTYNKELSRLPEESEKKIPDLIENSAKVGRACSEGGSVTDITQLFCTLPRKKAIVSSRYRSTDSQSPLLPESRYNSSGGESCGSEDNFRRMSDSQKYPIPNLNRNRVNKFSNSYLNLTKEGEVSSTPLLDITGLEKRVLHNRQEAHNITTPNANSYDYHAAQLEKFLEEYRSLQKELTKMKETCDNLKQDRQYLEVSPITPSSSEESARNANQLPVAVSPNSNHSLEDSVDFRNFESELTKYLISQSSPNFNKSGVYNN